MITNKLLRNIYKWLTIAFLLISGYAAFAGTQDEITRAISEGNCEFLFNFVQNPEGKDKQLIDDANNALKRYTRPDVQTGNYQSGSMDARVRGIGLDLTKKLFEDPQKYLPIVTAKLMIGVTDRFLKTKIIHDWICYHIAYDADTFFGKANRAQDYISVVKNRKAVCAGYSELFSYMCGLASVESIVITGYSKGYGYNGTLGPSPDHAWNAVRINNKWFLVDVTWDAGYLAHDSFVRKYTTYYLFLDSKPFLSSHLPVENKYQFYAPVINKEQFVKEPAVGGNSIRYWERIEVNTFEQRIVPLLDNLLQRKKITAREKDHFIKAYLKIPGSGYYYFYEDQFAVDRNNAVLYIHWLINIL